VALDRIAVAFEGMADDAESMRQAFRSRLGLEETKAEDEVPLLAATKAKRGK
jgi:hypothetical protein